MTLAERLPELDDKALTNLRDNARRIAGDASSRKAAEAAELLPLIDAEIADRKAKAPPPAPRARKAPVRRKVTH